MKKVSLMLSLFLLFTFVLMGLVACSGETGKASSQEATGSYGSEASEEAGTSEENDASDLEEALMGKWVDIILTSKSSIEFFDDHTAVLNLVDTEYDVEWEVTGGLPKMKILNLSFKVNGKEAFTGNFHGGEGGVLILTINGDQFNFRHK